MDIKPLFNLLPKSVFDELPSVIDKFSINTSLRLGHFLSQVAHESGNFVAKIENLSYSKEGLLKVFPKYFTLEQALQYHRKSEMIANRVYANRMGNGEEKHGDGWKFRGRGYIQLTGKNNYIEFDKFVEDNILENPNLVADKYPLFSAGWFWNNRKLNMIADKGDSVEVVTEVTKKVNGGTHGLQDRVDKFNKFYGSLNKVKDGAI